MNAEEMFKCLEYKRSGINIADTIIYKKVVTDYNLIDQEDENYNTWEKCSYIHCISFDLKGNSFNAYSKDYKRPSDEYPLSINAMEMIAINQQMKELGWIND